MTHVQTRPLHIFTGGKLEFRKGQDIVIEAFRRFRETTEGKDAKLVTAWDNPWPQTMDGIWLSGYVKGVPSVKQGRADIVGWLAANGIPEDAVIDCGKLSPAEMAQTIRRSDVGVFVSRAEGATNMVLVEALACGLPCIVSDGHGHRDLGYPTVPATGTVPTGCRLYKSTEGWSETDPDAIVRVLKGIQQDASLYLPAIERWAWSVRGPKIAESTIGSPTQFGRLKTVGL